MESARQTTKYLSLLLVSLVRMEISSLARSKAQSELWKLRVPNRIDLCVATLPARPPFSLLAACLVGTDRNLQPGRVNDQAQRELLQSLAPHFIHVCVMTLPARRPVCSQAVSLPSPRLVSLERMEAYSFAGPTIKHRERELL